MNRSFADLAIDSKNSYKGFYSSQGADKGSEGGDDNQFSKKSQSLNVDEEQDTFDFPLQLDFL